ncbi:MAG: ABC transporter ATP-binding protein/permease [Anaerolineae bacterium]|nr:ABC transporter ATP-binding protein/permease [Anaerolineae bacterium]
MSVTVTPTGKGQPAAVPWRPVAALLWPWRGQLAIIVGSVLLAAILDVIPPLITRNLIDNYLTVGRTDGILLLALFYLGVTVALQGMNFVTNYFTARVSQAALHRLRVRLFAHLQTLPLNYYDRTPLGDTISRCTADVETVDTLFSTGVARVMGDLIRLVTAGIAMVAVSLPLALISILVVPPLVVLTRAFQVRARAAERDQRRAVGVLNAHLQEVFGGVEVVRAFSRAPMFVARFRRAVAHALVAYNRSTAFVSLYPPMTNTMLAVAISILLWAGASGVFASLQISLGTLTAFILLFQRFFQPIVALGDEWQVVQRALTGLERVFQVLTLPPEPQPELQDAAQALRFRSSGATSAAPPLAELRDVVFGYAEDRPVLHGVSLRLAPGEHVAIVGRTGAGKSSAMHLLAGLYTPWQGEVTVLGGDPRSLSGEARRRAIGAVPQIVQLFQGSVRDNLVLGDGQVTEDDLRRAAEITGVAEFIATLPRGYDTVISSSGRGEGAQLSGGQRQLLSLMRALVWDPRVLLLDEATAAIDSASDVAFRAALRSFIAERDRAVVTVAHRLSTAAEADRVVVLQAGRIIEEGSPAELVRRGGHFAALLALEAAGWEWR